MRLIPASGHHGRMPDFTLLTLRLHANIPYEGLENPPFAGLPSPAEVRDLLPLVRGREAPLLGEAAPPAAPGGATAAAQSTPAQKPGRSGLEEGEEELFIFEEAELIEFDPDDGPRVILPLPPPRFYGRMAAPTKGDRKAKAEPSIPAPGAPAPEAPAGDGTAAPPSKDGAKPPKTSVEYSLAPGTYLFMQFRPLDAEEMRSGLEWFARESWWEAAAARGPYLVRRIAEDGELATQIIRGI
ncbi:MAG: hypothetical protein JNG85_06920 [Spirochaetaceae bacterium]|nr:hypothetical protein [Spirochaetaceae bacterium]